VAHMRLLLVSGQGDVWVVLRSRSAPVRAGCRPRAGRGRTARSVTTPIRCRRLRPSRSRRHTTGVSPARSSHNARSSCGRRSTAPDMCSTNTYRHPAAVSSSVCRSTDCSAVDTRAYPIGDPPPQSNETLSQDPFRHAEGATGLWDVPGPGVAQFWYTIKHVAETVLISTGLCRRAGPGVLLLPGVRPTPQPRHAWS